ncbi:DUF2971 domain-containing protein [Mycobacterium europaeum]|uniref:DUF2971 domain-containing protein n=1 Tax=Mycobacterium europaeum TaxID=761804 RepID=UPI002ADFC442|nr:DUF2971 domain-containing protein [Mycobacterium europaeum]MEA1159424.1 DUF2971 domain-containing protein [Mycobacterium europaeum]
MGIVYHYTDTQAFKGVIENAALWATDFRYLNDSGELVWTWAAFVERLDQLVKQPGDHAEAYRAQLEALRLMNARDLMQFDDAIFVACFSELRDEVTQWAGYGDKGRGVALGFDTERIAALKVPQYRHGVGGQVRPMTAIVGGGPNSGQEVEFTWPARLQKVAYGDAARDHVVDGLIDTVQRIGETSDSRESNVFNCISQTYALVHRLPLVKRTAWEYEQERRITITEHFGGRSLSYRRAVHSLGEPFSVYARGALESVDVQFRPGDATMFKPYVALPFEREALVEVITGPVVKHQLVEATVRRMLDRNGFRHTAINESKSPFQG